MADTLDRDLLFNVADTVEELADNMQGEKGVADHLKGVIESTLAPIARILRDVALTLEY